VHFHRPQGGCMVFLPPTGGIYAGARRAPTFIYYLPFTIYHFLIFPPTGIYHLSLTYFLYRDPSLTLRMTVGDGKRKSGQQIAVGVPLVPHSPVPILLSPLSHCPTIPPAHQLTSSLSLYMPIEKFHRFSSLPSISPNSSLFNEYRHFSKFPAGERRMRGLLRTKFVYSFFGPLGV